MPWPGVLWPGAWGQCCRVKPGIQLGAGAAGRLNRRAAGKETGPAWDLPGGPGPPAQGRGAGFSTSGNAALAPLRAQGRQEKNFSFNQLKSGWGEGPLS